MKPAAFDYLAPTDLPAALAALADGGGDAKVLAGGQSLVPAMNFRLARPALLIDINRLPGLDHVRVEDGQLRIGALARHARFERPVCDGPLGALLPRVARHIAHLPIRTRGTFAGSLAHADPSSEWCTTAVTLGATIAAASRRGERTIAAAEFFQTMFTTALATDEIVTEVRLPVLSADWRCGFQELSRRAGDYAIVMAMAALRFDGGTIAEARIGLGGVSGKAERVGTAEAVLIGHQADDALLAKAAAAAAAGCSPLEDANASADYRRHLVGVLVRRALKEAVGT